MFFWISDVFFNFFVPGNLCHASPLGEPNSLFPRMGGPLSSGVYTGFIRTRGGPSGSFDFPARACACVAGRGGPPGGRMDGRGLSCRRRVVVSAGWVAWGRCLSRSIWGEGAYRGMFSSARSTLWRAQNLPCKGFLEKRTHRATLKHASQV